MGMVDWPLSGAGEQRAGEPVAALEGCHCLSCNDDEWVCWTFRTCGGIELFKHDEGLFADGGEAQ
jgi:hypothetical protein